MFDAPTESVTTFLGVHEGVGKKFKIRAKVGVGLIQGIPPFAQFLPQCRGWAYTTRWANTRYFTVYAYMQAMLHLKEVAGNSLLQTAVEKKDIIASHNYKHKKYYLTCNGSIIEPLPLS